METLETLETCDYRKREYTVRTTSELTSQSLLLKMAILWFLKQGPADRPYTCLSLGSSGRNS